MYEYEKHEHAHHLIFSLGSFCLDYCSHAAWNGVTESVALLR